MPGRRDLRGLADGHPPRVRVARAVATLALLLATLLNTLPAARAEPAALRGVALVDHRGQSVRPASFDGRLLLLHFVFTGCSSTCPTQVHELAWVHDALPHSARQAVQILSVSVDPLSDTPAALAAFARRMDAERPQWRYATGAPTQVERLTDRMAAMAPAAATGRAARPEDHRTSIWLFDARGDLVQRYAGVPVDRARLAREITQLAAAPALLPVRHAR